MDVNRELNHIVSRNALTLILGVWLTCVRQIERCVKLLGSHRRVRWIDNHKPAFYALQQALGMHHIGLLLDVLKVFGLSLFILHALLVRMEYNVAIGNAAKDVFLTREINGLRQVTDITNALASSQSTCQFDGYFLAHAVGNHIGRRVAKQAFLQTVAPIIVVGNAAQRGLDATQHYRNIGIQLL